MKIILGYRMELDVKGRPIETYARSWHFYFKKAGHTVLPVGEGHPFKDIDDLGEIWKGFDLWLDIDNGRNKNGDLRFQYADQTRKEKVNLPSAVRFVDTHGYPSLHHRAAKKYDHVFFAVWDKRDCFEGHKSVYWCPNASDERWFYPIISPLTNKFSVGFFGTRGGIDRADELKEICEARRIECDVREVGRVGKQRWPETCKAMNDCRVLFNRGQKHDGPNQRVIESMLCGKPLITDRDPRDGMSKLFVENEHYLGYTTKADLGIALDYALSEAGGENTLALDMARRASALVRKKHLVQHRVEQVLEVVLNEKAKK